MWYKPKGGIWTSPVESKYGWDKWCDDERFCDTNKLTRIEIVIEISEDKNLIVIRDEKDLNKLL